MMGNTGATKRVRFNQTAAVRDEISAEPNNNAPNPLTPTLSLLGRGRRKREPMPSSEHISLAASSLESLHLHAHSELPRPEGERVGVRGLRR
jgi:hypothetical protein